MARAGARVRGARSGRVGSSGGFCRGDGHEPARELVGEFGRRRVGETPVTPARGRRCEPLYTFFFLESHCGDFIPLAYTVCFALILHVSTLYLMDILSFFCEY